MKPPTQEFLTELLERARRYGWDGDYHEITRFVKHLYREAGLTPPSGPAIEPLEK